MSEHTAEVCSIERSRIYKRRERNHHSENIWLSSEELHRRGILGKRLLFSTVGLDEAMDRAYIRNQEEEDERNVQMKLDVSILKEESQ